MTYHRVRLAALPLAGTYHVSVDVSGGQSFSFFARTMAGPETAWGSDGNRLPDSPLGISDSARPSPAGYYAMAFVGRTLPDLPTRRGDAELRGKPSYSFRIGAFPARSSAGTRVWAGATQFAVEAAASLATDPTSRTRYWELGRLVQDIAMTAEFVESKNGAVQSLQQHRLDDGRLITIRATRVSRSVVREQ